MRAVSRVADVSINTVRKLLSDVGAACLEYQDRTLRRLNCKRVQCDDIWSFIEMKQKNVPAELASVFGYGDGYTCLAIDADTKLLSCWHVDTRDGRAAEAFISDLSDQLAHRVQLPTDGHCAYLKAVGDAFNGHIDYAMLVKLYGDAPVREAARKHSPSEYTGCRVEVVSG